MKREERNQRTRDLVLKSAAHEFALHGYEAASMNAICAESHVSKGNLYHYYASKEDLYLACLRACFTGLAEEIRQMDRKEGSASDEDLLQRYFDTRMRFFREQPDLAQLFCRCTSVQESSMEDRIREVREEFDLENRRIIEKILRQKPIRKDLSREEAAQLFTMLQTMWNTAAPSGPDPQEPQKREAACRLLMNIFFYGILER
jgi:AcrR family transcriptional regulator